ncbi:MAG TPA: metalloregulator ArsR/SmtB family transcription factor [Gemmatimonadaceae bacterium]|jgi:DNA-binding transcriptional ArsR family regulator
MPVDSLSATLAAIADPTRRAILGRLARGESSVTALAKPFRMSLPAVSKHLKVLERAGLVERGRDAQWRPCRLRAQPLQKVAEWAEPFRRFWEGSFDRLDAYLHDMTAPPPPAAAHRHRLTKRTRRQRQAARRGRRR